MVWNCMHEESLMQKTTNPLCSEQKALNFDIDFQFEFAKLEWNSAQKVSTRALTCKNGRVLASTEKQATATRSFLFYFVCHQIQIIRRGNLFLPFAFWSAQWWFVLERKSWTEFHAEWKNECTDLNQRTLSLLWIDGFTWTVSFCVS